MGQRCGIGICGIEPDVRDGRAGRRLLWRARLHARLGGAVAGARAGAVTQGSRLGNRNLRLQHHEIAALQLPFDADPLLVNLPGRFRATFRTWTQECTNYREEVCELQLAHVNSDATRAAYARSELIEERRKMMSTYERLVLGKHRGKVVKMRERA